jgi:hypothetical protein
MSKEQKQLHAVCFVCCCCSFNSRPLVAQGSWLTESREAHHPRWCSALRPFPSIMTLPWKAGMDCEQGARAGKWWANGCHCSMAGEHHDGHQLWKTERSEGRWRWSFLQILKPANETGVKPHTPSNQVRPHRHIILFVNSLNQTGPVKTAANGPGWGNCTTRLKTGMPRVIDHKRMYPLSTVYQHDMIWARCIKNVSANHWKWKTSERRMDIEPQYNFTYKIYIYEASI